MHNEKILLGSEKHKLSSNEDNFINIELSSSEHHISKTEDSCVIDEYKRYFKEKDDSQNYRLAFTIIPYLTNVLFNVVTEVVYKEGSDECLLLYNHSRLPLNVPENATELKKYLRYTDRNGICSSGAVEDTGYSLPEAGGLTYHCGFDIFNNHYLRKKGFVLINRVNDKYEPPYAKSDFNTIRDIFRDYYGRGLKGSTLIATSDTRKISDTDYFLSLYKKATISTFFESISNNLTERNGWFGFLNKSTLPIENYFPDGEENKGYIINKVMNNLEAGDFVDMYPDRSLFSFIPKYNEYRKRVEPNWSYCITYPFSSSTENYLINNDEHNINGILTKIVTKFTTIDEAPLNITFKTLIKNNLSVGDYITLTFIGLNGGVKKTEMVRVESVGVDDEDTEHYFSVKLNKIINSIVTINSDSGEYEFLGYNDIRLRKCVQGIECKYYMRMFKKIVEHGSQLSKMAFSQTAFSDQVAQILFTEDINTEGIVDNLNRQVSELFLTVVKNNNGYDKWYTEETNPEITFSHCFGEITSGFDLPEDNECKEYNVHRIHSINATDLAGIENSPNKLENGITIENSEFCGDIVELSISELKETVLENVYHRFNTSQRESTSDKVKDFKYTEIEYDSYEQDATNTFLSSSATRTFGVQNVNILPEGYFYKPHYLMKVRDFSEGVNEGYHIKLAYTAETEYESSAVTIELGENYYFQSGKTPDFGTNVYVYKKVQGKYYEFVATGYCTEILSENYRKVRIGFPGTFMTFDSNYILFKHNTEMPQYAYDLKDGSGKYIWRDVMSFSEMSTNNELYNTQFTNGAHYHHKNIQFYLKRQDPDGKYGVGLEPEKLSTFIIENEETNVSGVKYKRDSGNIIC